MIPRGILFAVFVLGVSAGVIAQEPEPGVEEFEARLQGYLRRIEDPATSAGDQIEAALEASVLIDNEARRFSSIERRSAIWKRGISLLEGVASRITDDESRRDVDLQAAVFQWAISADEVAESLIRFGDAALRKRAETDSEAAVARLRSVLDRYRKADESFSTHARFRLAMALSEQARVVSDRLRQDSINEEALDLLEVDPPSRGPLRAHFLLLKAELQVRGRWIEKAEYSISLAEKSDPPPPAEMLLEAKFQIFMGRRRFEDAERFAEESKGSPDWKAWSVIRAGSARVRTLNYSYERREILDKVTKLAASLRGGTSAAARSATTTISQDLDGLWNERLEPGQRLVLADGFLQAGDSSRAERSMLLAAEEFRAKGRLVDAAKTLLDTAALNSREGRDQAADQILGRIITDVSAGEIRPRAGMLRVLLRGRRLAEGSKVFTFAQYRDALIEQIRAFPKYPGTDEARWYLGSIRRGEGRLSEAIETWSEIAPEHPKRFLARVGAFELRFQLLGNVRVGGDAEAFRREFASLREFLDESRRSSKAPSEQADLEILAARLELVPGAGNPRTALETCQAVLRRGVTDDQRSRAKLLEAVALLAVGRHSEADRAFRAPGFVEGLSAETALLGADLLDQIGSAEGADAIRSRCGTFGGVVLRGLGRTPNAVPKERLDEFRLRDARAALFRGENALARKRLAEIAAAEFGRNDRFLRDLSDAYLRLGAFDELLETSRLRADVNQAGSHAWIEARYMTALAYYRSRRPAEARKILDAAAVLYPDLGNSELKDRFERLRQRLGEPEP